MASTRAQRDVNPRQECLHPDSHGAAHAHTPPGAGALGGVCAWTSAEAGAKRSEMSGATAAGACETGDAEQREGAGGGNGTRRNALIGHGVVAPLAHLESRRAVARAAGRSKRGVQCDVRRDGGGRQRDQLRREARGRPGRG